MSGQVEGIPLAEAMPAGQGQPGPARSRSKGPRYLVLLIVLLLTAAGAVGIGLVPLESALRGMNERMRQLKGKLDIIPKEGGTMVRATIPAIQRRTGKK